MKNRIWFIFFLFAGCSSSPDKPYSDTPTSGKVDIVCDETLQPLADAEKDTFMGLYRYAKLNVQYKAETDCFKDLINDSVKVVISARKLQDAELAYFNSRNLIPVTTKIAIDAIALVVNKDNADTLLKLSQLKSILIGNIQNWKDIDSKSDFGKISLVFDNNGSSNVRYLKDSLISGNNFSSNCFAVNSNASVIDYVEKNKNAIGLIGVSWISDRDDPQGMKFLSRISVMELATSENPVFPDDYYKPYQAYIALEQYPLRREIYMISREGRAGLGTGFVSFVASDNGQRIIRLAGLLPATMPVRLIKSR